MTPVARRMLLVYPAWLVAVAALFGLGYLLELGDLVRASIPLFWIGAKLMGLALALNLVLVFIGYRLDRAEEQ